MTQTNITAADAAKALAPFMSIRFTGNTYMPNKAKTHKLARESEQAHNLAKGDVTSYISAFPKHLCGPLDTCNKAWGALRSICQSHPIVPFGDTSHRYTGLLSAAYYVGELAVEYAKLYAIAQDKLELLVTALPSMISSAEATRTNSAISIEYPTEMYTRNKFRCPALHLMISPIDRISDPSSIVFPADAAANLVDDIVNRGIESSEVVQNMRATVSTMQHSLIESMNTLSLRVGEFENGDSVRFTSALTQNVTNTLATMRACNLFDAPDVTKLADAIEKRLYILKPERIKASKQGAKEARETADALADIATRIEWQ